MRNCNSLWLLIAAYVATASGALLALHRSTGHPGSSPAVAESCCHSSTEPVPGEHPLAPRGKESPAHGDCALCDALFASPKATAIPTPSGLIPLAIAMWRVASNDARPVATACPGVIQPRAPPTA